RERDSAAQLNKGRQAPAGGNKIVAHPERAAGDVIAFTFKDAAAAQSTSGLEISPEHPPLFYITQHPAPLDFREGIIRGGPAFVRQSWREQRAGIERHLVPAALKLIVNGVCFLRLAPKYFGAAGNKN